MTVVYTPLVVPRLIVYDVAPGEAAQVKVIWLVPAAATRLAGAAGVPTPQVSISAMLAVVVADPVTVTRIAVALTGANAKRVQTRLLLVTLAPGIATQPEPLLYST